MCFIWWLQTFVSFISLEREKKDDKRMISNYEELLLSTFQIWIARNVILSLSAESWNEWREGKDNMTVWLSFSNVGL